MRLRKTIRRASIALLLFAVLLIVVAKLWLKDKTEIGKMVTFSDGSTMTLCAVTYGMESRYPGDSTMERFLSVLPDKLTRRFLSNKNLMESSTGRPEVVLWFRHLGPGPVHPQIVLCDDNGFETTGHYAIMGPTAKFIEGWSFCYWPRRGETFKVRIYEHGQDPNAKSAGEFVVSNPTPGQYPNWKASPLPITSRAVNLAVTLFDLTAGVGRGSNMRKPAPNATISQTRAGFRLEEKGHPTKDWELVGVETSDATGNLITRIYGYGAEDDALYGELQPHPSTAESAWKLRVGFARTTNFESPDLWTIHIPLSDSGEISTNLMQTNLHNVSLKYAGYDLRKYIQDGHEFTFKMKSLTGDNRPMKDYQLSVAKAVDDTGRVANFETTYTCFWDETRV